MTEGTSGNDQSKVRKHEELLTFDEDEGFKGKSAEKNKSQQPQRSAAPPMENKYEAAYKDLSMRYEETVKKLEDRDKKLIYYSKIIEDKNKDVQLKQALEKEREALIAERDQRISNEEELNQSLNLQKNRVTALESELDQLRKDLSEQASKKVMESTTPVRNNLK